MNGGNTHEFAYLRLTALVFILARKFNKESVYLGCVVMAELLQSLNSNSESVCRMRLEFSIA